MKKKEIDRLIENWNKRNIGASYFCDKIKAKEKILESIPAESEIGISGSQTLEQLGIIKELELKGYKIYNQYKEGLTRQESLELRRQGSNADCYLASANAIAYTGELVFFSAFGNRIAGISQAKKVILVCGVNKIVPTLEEAIKRAREYVAPLNCKRLNYNSACFNDGICRKDICFGPAYKRMCCQLLILEAEAIEQRLNVFLIEDNLGF
ncbi:MAG: lactate utilization protein [Candidatus Omnitrophota bacterium]